MKKFYKIKKKPDGMVFRYAKNEEDMYRNYTEEIALSSNYSYFLKHLMEKVKENEYKKPTYYWIALCKSLAIENQE